MSAEDSESRRLQLNIRLSFSQADVGPTSAQEICFSFFLESLELFFWRFVLIASGTEILWRVSLKFELFLATSRFHCHRSSGMRILHSCWWWYHAWRMITLHYCCYSFMAHILTSTYCWSSPAYVMRLLHYYATVRIFYYKYLKNQTQQVCRMMAAYS